ncbi:MAG: TonB-dependent receptor, partial [Bacteroidota bacterium]
GSPSAIAARGARRYLLRPALSLILDRPLMLSPRFRPLGLLLACATFTGGALAQPVGQLAGRVTDTDGTALAGATVVFVDTPYGTATGADGRFVIAGVPHGAYTLRVTSVGYVADTRAVTIGRIDADPILVTLERDDAQLGEVVVEGRAASLVGTAQAASDGVVGRAELEARPLLRVGEVLETIPGLIVTQHSGSGKANQFFLRGFNLDHGTDFSASVDGIPANLPTHAHGQGYLDLNFLIPELIDRVAFEKGTHDVEAGDFSTAGRAEIQFARRLDEGIARATAGSDESAEALVAASSTVGGGDLLAAVRGRYANGPWVTPENSSLVSALAKFSMGTEADGLSLTALAYASDWTATDQVARRAVADGQIGRFGTLDPTNGGTTGRYSLAGTWRQPGARGARTEVTAYGVFYHLNLFSNFTYFLDDPVNGDQFEQAERRLYGGGRVTHRRPSRLGQSGTTSVGLSLRHDQVFGIGLHQTSGRQRLATIREDDVAESTAGVFVEAETQWSPLVRTVVGVRADAFRFDVSSDRSVNSGTETAVIASPKGSIALGPWNDTELYLNAGLGFHSNDARGTVIQVDPATGEPVDTVDPLVRTRGAELGLRTLAVRGFQSTVSLWALDLDSELVFVGDAGGTEASDASRHLGVEWANHVAPVDGLTLTVDVALTRSRFTAGDADGERIENSIGRVVSAGAVWDAPLGVTASAQVRHFGPRPLTGDGRVTEEATTLVNARLSAPAGPLDLALDVLNLLDTDDADVSYFYASRLIGEPAGGVEDVHAHPVLPRSLRLSASARF